MEAVRLAGIKVPISPTADMTKFNWDDKSKFISAKNVAVADGFTGRSSRVYIEDPNIRRRIFFKGLDDFYFTKTSNDVAIIDFGAGSLSLYPPTPIAASKEFDIQRDEYRPANFIGSDKEVALRRGLRESRKAYQKESLLSGDKNRFAFSSATSGPLEGVYDVGCWGDSGSPVFNNAGKIVGIASTIGQSPNSPLRTQRFGCGNRVKNPTSDGTGTVTYVSPDLTEIIQLQATSNKYNSRGYVDSVTLQNLDFRKIEAENDDLDAKLSSELRSFHFIASTSAAFVVSGALPNGSSVWSQLVDPATKILSQTPGGTIRQATAAGSGTRTATWNFPTLTPGYYRLEILYPRRFDNASCVVLQTKSTLQASFGPLPCSKVAGTRCNLLNQQLGTGLTSQSTTFSNTKTNVTPFNVSNPNSYIWVDPAANSKSGNLSVRLSDTGCSSGRMVADTVVLTWISGKK
jgi:hypothetical protein